MSEDRLLKKFAELLLANNKKLLQSVEQSTAKAIEKSIKESEDRIKKELTEKIEFSQKDTIDTLTELMHTGYGLHEGRIQRLEDELNLPPLKQKH